MIRKKKIQEAHVAALLKCKEGILFIRKRKGHVAYWSLPSGKIELHETPQIALKRIVWAETGFLVEPETVGNFVHSQILNNRNKTTHRLTSLFRVRKTGGEIRAEQAKFIKPAEVARTRLNEQSRAMLQAR